MKKQLILVCIILIGAFLTLGCTDNSKENETTQAQNTTNSIAAGVSINNYRFAPDNVNIYKGETVQWNNRDSVAHDVTFDKFNSTTLKKFAIYSHTFNEAGTFEYHCSLHPTMKGTITVKEK